MLNIDVHSLNVGVCLSHAALFSEFDTANVKIYVNGIVFNSCSLFWISGMLTLLLGTICGAKRIITTENFSLEMHLRIIKQYKVTLFENVPYDLHLMLKNNLVSDKDLANVKHVIVSGYKYPFSVLQKFNSLLPNGNLHNVYGLTELGDVSIDFPHFSGKDSAGQLVNGLTVKIVDEEGNRCGINVDGEVCVKGRNKFLGYYKDEQLSKEAVDSEGFFLTGDIGHIDEYGYLYIADRKKNVINHRDDWVFPAEVEEVLLKSPDIKAVCLVGVPVEEPFEVPAAFIVRVNGSQITEEEVCKLVEGICQFGFQVNKYKL